MGFDRSAPRGALGAALFSVSTRQPGDVGDLSPPRANVPAMRELEIAGNSDHLPQLRRLSRRAATRSGGEFGAGAPRSCLASTGPARAASLTMMIMHWRARESSRSIPRSNGPHSGAAHAEPPPSHSHRFRGRHLVSPTPRSRRRHASIGTTARVRSAAFAGIGSFPGDCCVSSPRASKFAAVHGSMCRRNESHALRRGFERAGAAFARLRRLLRVIFLEVRSVNRHRVRVRDLEATVLTSSRTRLRTRRRLGRTAAAFAGIVSFLHRD